MLSQQLLTNQSGGIHIFPSWSDIARGLPNGLEPCATEVLH